MRFVSDEEWLRASTPPVTAAREGVTDDDRQEALRLSVAIAHATRSVSRQWEDFARRPVTFADLAALGTDPQAAWAAWLEPLRSALSAVAAARQSERRLVALLGADATLPDHGWGHARESITLATIADAVATAETLVAPVGALEKALSRSARRAA